MSFVLDHILPSHFMGDFNGTLGITAIIAIVLLQNPLSF